MRCLECVESGSCSQLISLPVLAKGCLVEGRVFMEARLLEDKLHPNHGVDALQLQRSP
jgi:hypothetical protein